MAQWRNDQAYVRKREALRRQARKNDTPCHICGHRIDYDLPWKHPQSFTADHIDPVAKGGSMTGQLAPAHRACNSRRGTKDIGALKRAKQPRTSREW